MTDGATDPTVTSTPAADDPVLQSLRLAPFGLDDAALDWVRTVRAGLDTEARLRQLCNLAMHGDAPEEAARIAALGVGGVTRFVGANLEAAWSATRSLVDSAEIPLLVSGDIEGGAIAISFASQMPNQLGLAASGQPELVERAVEVLAAEAKALGYNWSFTPVLDINAAFRSAIVATRSYGSNPQVIEALALRNVRAFQRAGIAATAKHWPGEGYDDRDQHLLTTLNPLSEADWQASFGRLYRSLIEAGVMSIMAGHIAWPAYARRHGAEGLEACRPASISALLTQKLLREELGFNGLIISDASAMAGLGSWGARADFVPEVIANGCDMLLFPMHFETDLQHLLDAVADGRLSLARVDAAVTRVLGLKAALGLHRQQPRMPTLAQAQQTIRCESHLALQDQAAGAGITLVKDVQGLLPLSPQKHRRIVLLTDPQRAGFVAQPPLPLLLPQWLADEGFELRPHDPDNPPTADNCDLLLYLLAQESLLGQANIYLDWKRLHGQAIRPMMSRYWPQLPCLLVSLGQPYYLYDAPRMPCVVNAYSAIEPVQRALLARLLGRAPFSGRSPVDASCGLADAMY